MSQVVIFFNPDNAQLWDLVLSCAEAGHQVSVCPVDDLVLPANRIEVSVPAPKSEDAPCQPPQ